MEIIRNQFRTLEGEKGIINEKNENQEKFENELHNDQKFIDTVNAMNDGELSPVMDIAGKQGKVHKRGDDINIYYVKDTLFIPEEIFNQKLSKEQRKTLESGGVIVLNSENKNLYLQIDKETNSIVVRGDKDFNIPKRMGASKKFGYDGYELSTLDRTLLANGKSTDKKLLCGENGFFLAEVALTPDKKGVAFSNYTSLTDEQAKNYQKAMSEIKAEKAPEQVQQQEQGKQSQDIAMTTDSKTETVIKENITKDTETTKEKTVENVINERQTFQPNQQDLEFRNAIKDNDYIALTNLAKEGYLPNEALLKEVELKGEQKVAVEKIFNIDPKKEKAKIMTLPEEKGEQGKNNAKETVLKTTNTLFQGM